jgi:hypothetical protein
MKQHIFVFLVLLIGNYFGAAANISPMGAYEEIALFVYKSSEET